MNATTLNLTVVVNCGDCGNGPLWWVVETSTTTVIYIREMLVVVERVCLFLLENLSVESHGGWPSTFAPLRGTGAGNFARDRAELEI